MAAVLIKLCSHASCIKRPMWGVITFGSASVCARHKSGVEAGLVIKFNGRCVVTGCDKMCAVGGDRREATYSVPMSRSSYIRASKHCG